MGSPEPAGRPAPIASPTAPVGLGIASRLNDPATLVVVWPADAASVVATKIDAIQELQDQCQGSPRCTIEQAPAGSPSGGTDGVDRPRVDVDATSGREEIDAAADAFLRAVRRAWHPILGAEVTREPRTPGEHRWHEALRRQVVVELRRAEAAQAPISGAVSGAPSLGTDPCTREAPTHPNRREAFAESGTGTRRRWRRGPGLRPRGTAPARKR